MIRFMARTANIPGTNTRRLPILFGWQLWNTNMKNRTIKLTILGSGTFFVSKDRSSSAYLLEADNKRILIDCGPGTLMRLSQAGIKPWEIDYVFITHFHADHTADLFPFFMNIQLNDYALKGNSAKFPQIIGPKGIAKFMIKSSENYELPSVRGWNKVTFTDIKNKMRFGAIRVEPFKIKHIAFGIMANGYAYRFIINKKVIAFSGDSTKCFGLEKSCRNADIFICDASYSKKQNNGAHIDTSQIGKMSSKCGVKQVVLSHLYPRTDNIDLIEEVKEFFSGKVIRGEDLKIILL